MSMGVWEFGRVGAWEESAQSLRLLLARPSLAPFEHGSAGAGCLRIHWFVLWFVCQYTLMRNRKALANASAACYDCGALTREPGTRPGRLRGGVEGDRQGGKGGEEFVAAAR